MKLATEHYAQIPYALIASPAWSVLNIHERRTIDRMLIEHARHWKDNGRLVITTRNLKAHGVHPRHVSASLKVIEALGLVECTQRGRGGYAAEFRRPSFWRWVKIETIEQAKEIAEKHRVHETRGQGRNVEIDYRWTAGNASLAQAVAEELIALRPDILVVNSTAALLAARQAAGALPIVVAAIADPVAQGFVPSLVRPGGNITGFAVEEPVMGAKWVELLKEIAPHVGHITVIFNPSSAPFARMFLPSMEGVRTSFSLEANRFPHSQ